MLHQVILAGFGGQGVMTAGKILAEAALREGKNVSWLPSYGPEMRGGTANCHVVISDDLIGNPIITEASAVMALNQPSYDKFQGNVAPGGKLILNSSLVSVDSPVKDIETILIPANDIANSLGNKKVINMIMLGAYLKATGIVQISTVIEIVSETLGQKNPDLLKLNQDALLKGAELAGPISS
ncbi:2-oxoacid:acceptor oxidoreductase family protein [Bacillota bacterium]